MHAAARPSNRLKFLFAAVASLFIALSLAGGTNAFAAEADNPQMPAEQTAAALAPSDDSPNSLVSLTEDSDTSLRQETEAVEEPAADETTPAEQAVNETTPSATEPTTGDNASANPSAESEENASTGESASEAAASEIKTEDATASTSEAATEFITETSAETDLKQAERELTALLKAPAKLSSSNGTLVIVIDPGHAKGVDTGASSNGLHEEDLTLAIAKYIREYLSQYSGIKVYLTRTDGTPLGSDTASDLLARVEYAESVGADVFVSVHINAGGGTGFECYAFNDSSYRKELAEESQELAQSILDAQDELGFRDRGVKTWDGSSTYPDGSTGDYLSVLRNSRKAGIVAVLSENLFIDNSNDAAYLAKDANLKKIGYAIALGIVNQYDLHKNFVTDSKGLRYRNNDGTYAISAWVTDSGATYYFGSDGYAVRWTQTIDNGQYYFNGNYQMQTGWITWNGENTKSYFEDTTGTGHAAALSGWQTIDGDRYYFDPKNWNHSVRWTQKIDGAQYYFNGASAMQTGWITWNGEGTKTYFDPKTGAAVSGWQTIEEVVYYFDPMSNNHSVRWTRFFNMPRGTLVESLKDGGVQYYFNGASQMVMGWITWNADGSKTFFDLVTGVAKSGFYTDSEGDTYYFDPAADNHTVRWTHYISGNRYYFNGNGVMQKGLIRWNSTGDYSFFGENGAAASGLTAVGDVTYCFNPDTFTSLRWSQTINGKLYYFDSDYTMVTGWVKWNGENASSYFGEDGAAYSGWHDIDESRYYFDPAKNFRNVKWTQYIEGSRYYFDSNARMVTGWIQWNSGDGKGLYSYFATPDGAMVYGEQVIDGVSYDFGTTGYVDRDDLRIMGASRTTAAQMARYYIQSVGSSTYPSDVYAQYGAKNINEFTQIVFEEAEAEGVRAEVLFAQVVHETGYLKFGGDVSADQCNFGGLGATGGGNPGIDFVELSIDRGYGKQNAVRIGLRAQTQHLKAYGSTDDLNQEKVDDRFGYVSPRGKAPTVMELGGTWAADKGYGEALAKIIQDILEA